MKNQNYLTMSGIVLLGLSLIFAGCSGDGSSGTTAAGSGGSAPSFNVKGSSQLIALSNTVAASAKPSGNIVSKLFSSPKPLEYTIVNQGLSDAEVRARAKGKSSAGIGISNAASTAVLKGTNLLSVDAQGNAKLAITADFLVKIMYSVTDPKGEYVYLALDTGFLNPDGNDYTQFIALNNCAFYRVSLADNSYLCVKEGVYVQPIDETYNKTVSANVKPIQFDAQGNVYFPGTAFSSKCGDSGLCTLFVSNWSPRIFRYKPSTGDLLTLTQDNQKISYYLALNSGEIAYQSVDNNGTTIYIWQPDISGGSNPNGITINLTGATDWINFFAADTYNTIMFGGFTKAGIRFAKPAVSGALKAVLDTTLFNQGYDYYYGNNYAPPPAKVIVGDNGKLYGVFGPNIEGKNEEQPDGTSKYMYYDVYRLYQILPALSVAKAEIRTIRDSYYSQSRPFQAINIFGGTPFQVANGYFFYKETKELLGYGIYDVIQMVDLNTRKVTTLLDGGVNGSTLYQLFSWRVRGNKLYFSALDLGRTQIVSGRIDTSLVAQGALQSSYLNTQNIASALGATSRVQDIEGTSALPTISVGSAPFVKSYFMSAENRYSLGIEFNELMNEASTEQTLQFGGAQGPVAKLAVWIQNALHLIPDLDNNNTGLANDALLDLNKSTPLNYDTPYTLSVSSSASDRDGVALASSVSNPSSKTFKTLPYGGWYMAGDAARFAGPRSSPTSANYSDKAGTYDLNMNIYSAAASTVIKNVPQDFRVEFDAKNTSYTNLEVLLYDKATYTNPPYYGVGYQQQRNVFTTSIQSGYVQSQYARCDTYDTATPFTCTSSLYGGSLMYWYPSCNSYPEIMNGNWARYRIDTYGSNHRISYSTDGGQVWTLIKGTCPSIYYPETIDKIVNRRVDDGASNYELFLNVYNGGLSIDNLEVWKLNSTGGVSDTSPILSEKFEGRAEGTDGLNTAPALDGTVKNVPNLKTRTPNYQRNDGSTPLAPYDFLDRSWW